MSRKLKLIYLFLLLTTSLLMAENNLELVEFPEKSEVSYIGDALYSVTPLLDQKINKLYTNINDLLWLKTVAKSKKMVIIGENHYHKSTSYLAERIFFALNQYDHFPIILLERPYSLSAYWSHFVTIEDDNVAKKFYKKHLHKLLLSKHDYELLEDIRRWNKSHTKKLSIGTIDMEHDYLKTLENIITPFLYSHKYGKKLSWRKLSDAEIKKKVKIILKHLKRIPENKKTSESFLTLNYIKNVLENILERLNVKNNYLKVRQKMLIKAVTHKDYYGDFTDNGKVVLNMGEFHASTRKNVHYPNTDIQREGSYFSYDYEPTKGKVYSITIFSNSYTLCNMSTYVYKTKNAKKWSYKELILTLQDYWKNGKIDRNKPYFLPRKELNMIDKLYAKASYDTNHLPFIMRLDLSKKITLKKNEKNELEKYYKNSYLLFDTVIVHTHSPVMENIALE